eukprot:5456432-Amphidinium_carterae.2
MSAGCDIEQFVVSPTELFELRPGEQVVRTQAIRKSRYCIGRARIHFKCERYVCVAKHWFELLDCRQRESFARSDLLGLATRRICPFA